MPYLTQLAAVARRTGYPVTECPGWKTRGHGPQPAVQGVVCHHTAGWNDMHVVRDGRPGLEGPLSQIWLRRDGRIFIVAAGRCWHNAPSTSVYHQNSSSIGIEAENNGSAPWPEAQLDSYQRLCAELCKEFGLTAARVKGHKEVNRQKVDPHSISMDGFRAQVARLMTGAGPIPGKAGPHEEDDDVPEIVSLGAGQDQDVPAGGELAVRWHTEYTDDADDHGAEGVAVLADGTRWAMCDALVKLGGLEPGDEVDLAWTRYSRDGKELLDDPWRLTVHADPDGRVEQSVPGQFGLGKDNQLRLRVINPGTRPAKLEKVTMAKVALFRR
ncbi:peptidoglycan recognition protein family protein [Sphaerisporangium aureirubrum]|uniref:N-acetylmuramoyl-L-alanine amidase n=1 Tax=Sphaerisporangium aureirubrum TaxID=1544736 RepID=A0ABW1NC24_9ACTN